MLKRLHLDCCVVSEPSDFLDCTHLILPGVGSFDAGMRGIASRNLMTSLNESVLITKLPVLGICLGAQLMTQRSEEGELDGLGWFKSKTVKFSLNHVDEKLPFPNIGWRTVSLTNSSSPINLSVDNESRFYFVHGFHFLAEPSESWLSSNYGYDFCCGLMRDNIFSVQFHPEKSLRFGFRLLQAFSAIKSPRSK